MSDNPTLYWNMMSPTCRAVKALIDIGKIPCKYVNVDLMKGEQKKPHILKLHPFGKIPFLVHGDLVVG
jgi:glutathione S-transferase